MNFYQLDALRQALSFWPSAGPSVPEAAEVSFLLSGLVSRLAQPGYTMSPGEADSCRIVLELYIATHPSSSERQRALLDWIEQGSAGSGGLA